MARTKLTGAALAAHRKRLAKGGSKKKRSSAGTVHIHVHTGATGKK